MNFHDKREIPPKYIYLFLAIICLILLFFSVVFGNRFTALKKITSTVIVPMQTGINRIGSSIYNDVSEHKSKAELIKINQELNAKLDDYSAQLNEYEQNNHELVRLQQLLGLQEQYAEYQTIGARVIATDSTNWFSTFIINKGTNDGIQVGCNILANGGLAGIVTEVSEDFSKVRAIIDDNSNVSATISGEDILCTVSGDLKAIKNGYINVGYLNKAVEINENAELVTSHVSDKFLPGILIGYITEIELDANNLTKSAKCIPVVDFNNLQEVLVILNKKADYHTNSENHNLYDSLLNSPISEPKKNRESMSTNDDSIETESVQEEITSSPQEESEQAAEEEEQDTSNDRIENEDDTE